MIFKKSRELIFKKNNKFGTYPCCDHLNVALRYLLKDRITNKSAIDEICQAIYKADGYFYEDVADELILNGVEK